MVNKFLQLCCKMTLLNTPSCSKSVLWSKKRLKKTLKRHQEQRTKRNRETEREKERQIKSVYPLMSMKI